MNKMKKGGNPMDNAMGAFNKAMGIGGEKMPAKKMGGNAEMPIEKKIGGNSEEMPIEKKIGGNSEEIPAKKMGGSAVEDVMKHKQGGNVHEEKLEMDGGRKRKRGGKKSRKNSVGSMKKRTMHRRRKYRGGANGDGDKLIAAAEVLSNLNDDTKYDHNELKAKGEELKAKETAENPSFISSIMSNFSTEKKEVAKPLETTDPPMRTDNVEEIPHSHAPPENKPVRFPNNEKPPLPQEQNQGGRRRRNNKN